MTVDEVLAELESLGSEQTKKVLSRHGAREPFFGVKVGDLKTLVKRIKVDHELALDLYATGNSDAMYLAGLIADDARMTKRDLKKWAREAYWYMIAEYTVPWVAAGSRHGFALARGWVEAKKEPVAACGWCTWSSLLATRQNEEFDLDEVRALLERVSDSVHDAPNRVRYTMNGFVTSVGGYVPDLTDEALAVADAVGKVDVDMGGTSCKVPDARTTIEKMQQRGIIGRKRKTAKC